MKLESMKVTVMRRDVSQHTTWREFKDQITEAKLLYIKGIPAAVYILCWAVSATFLWIARGFGMAGGEKRGGTKFT
jgi:hypothetical protein